MEGDLCACVSTANTELCREARGWWTRDVQVTDREYQGCCLVEAILNARRRYRVREGVYAPDNTCEGNKGGEDGELHVGRAVGAGDMNVQKADVNRSGIYSSGMRLRTQKSYLLHSIRRALLMREPDRDEDDALMRGGVFVRHRLG